jgi:16S rRNA (uracil1498-N3)-methyltransferase
VSSPPRFWAPPESWSEELVRLPADESHHALAVLRLGRGDELTVTDGSGRVARCVLRGGDGETVEAGVLEVTTHRRPRPELAVFQGAAKGTKLHALTERLAALGVAEMRVFGSERSVVAWDEPKRARLEARWGALARAGAKQSRSPWVMSTGAPLRWAELVARLALEGRAVVLWEEATEPLRSALADAARIALVVGPEGGLARHEAAELADAGARLASLGPRILRTEEAAVVAAAGILWHFGAIG